MVSLEPAEYFEAFFAFLGLLVRKYGPAGIATAMFAESAGVPFASAVVIVTAGSFIYSGRVGFWTLLVASTAGITLGSILEYALGYLSSTAGHLLKNTWGRKLSPRKPAPRAKSRVLQFWESYGSFSVFMGQLFGVTRTFISFPAGAVKMNFFLFVAYTALGGALFSALAIGFSVAVTGFLGLLLHYVMTLPAWAWVGALFALVLLVFTAIRLGWHTRLFRLLERMQARFAPRK